MVPTRRGWRTHAGEHELHHVAGVFSAVGEARMHHVEVQQEERAGRDVVQHHAAGLHRLRVQMAAGLDAGGAHRHRHGMGKIEADEITRHMMAGAGERALRVLMPAGTRGGALAHRRGVCLRSELDVRLRQRRAGVDGAVRVQAVAVAQQGNQGASHHRAIEHSVHLRHPGEDVVAVPRFAFASLPEQCVHLLMCLPVHIRCQTQEAIGDELADTLVVEQHRWPGGLQFHHCGARPDQQAPSAYTKARSAAARIRALVSA